MRRHCQGRAVFFQLSPLQLLHEKQSEPQRVYLSHHPERDLKAFTSLLLSILENFFSQLLMISRFPKNLWKASLKPSFASLISPTQIPLRAWSPRQVF